jgi:hypothetical protein
MGHTKGRLSKEGKVQVKETKKFNEFYELTLQEWI